MPSTRSCVGVLDLPKGPATSSRGHVIGPRLVLAPTVRRVPVAAKLATKQACPIKINGSMGCHWGSMGKCRYPRSGYMAVMLPGSVMGSYQSVLGGRYLSRHICRRVPGSRKVPPKVPCGLGVLTERSGQRTPPPSQTLAIYATPFPVAPCHQVVSGLVVG